MPLGVCYYPEHWPSDRWAQDAQLMREAGLEWVRIGEFAWSLLEPQPGVYTWEWLDTAIDVLGAAGLKVVLGTPTATPPVWLTEAEPHVLRVDRSGQRLAHGGRRHACVVNPRYREYCATLTGQLVERYGAHPVVGAWQIDNELGNHGSARCYCPACRTAWQAWLAVQYSDIAALNAAWGTVFWSQTYVDWSQVPLPSDVVGGGHNPALELAYRRWASQAQVAFCREQVALVRQAAPGRTILTNIAPGDDEIDWFDLAAEVDTIAWDNYPHGFSDWSAVAFFHDLMRGLKQQPFWVMEQQPGPINWTRTNPPVAPGQVRLWTYQDVAHGAENVLFFRWRACRFAQEQYHSGLLNHAAQPTRGYSEAQQVAEEWQIEQPQRAPVDVALLVDYRDLWAQQIDPHGAEWSYWELARTIHRSLLHHGLQVDVIRRGSELDRYKVVIAVAPMMIDQAEADQWRSWVAAGGTLILTPRSFTKDVHNSWTDQVLPGTLTSLCGAEVAEWSALAPDQPWQAAWAGGEAFDVPVWAEILQPTTAQSFVHYTQGYAAEQSAATAHQTGAGLVVLLGAYPVPALLAGVWQRIWPDVAMLPQSVERIWLSDASLLLLNHAADAVEVKLAGDWHDRLSDQLFHTTIEAPAWGVMWLSKASEQKKKE